MQGANTVKPSKPVAFMSVLCLLMLAGELVGEWVFKGGGNPMAIGFYCFLPVALWMITDRQERDAVAIAALEARIDQLEAGRSVSALPKAG